MKYYHTSTGERVSKSVVDRRITEAKQLKIETMKDEYGYIFCEECSINSLCGIPLDCSHDISVNESQKTGHTELAWSVDNITIRCRNCHHEHDHKSKFNLKKHMNTFEKIKQKILERAHKVNAYKEQYGRAYKSESIEELCEVIKDNFYWACNNSVLDGELIDKFKEVFSENKIYHNVSVETGYLYASGSITVMVSGSARVMAYDSATIEVSGSARVMAYNSATVMAYNSATVMAYGSATVRAYDSATVRAYDSATVMAYNSATVMAYGSAYINCHSTIKCIVSGNAIARHWDTNTIQYASGDLKFEKLETPKSE